MKEDSEQKKENMSVFPHRMIKVSFRGPTYSKGSRWIVSSPGYSRKVYPVDHSLDTYDDVFGAGLRFIREQGIEAREVRFGVYKNDYFLLITRST